VALGESARRIVILETSHADRPRVIGALSLSFAAHDLSFSPDGSRVWITSSTSSQVTVLNARTRRVAFRVGVGPAPQHIAFDGRTAYLTSGYGGRIESVNAATGAVIRRTSSPYGSFELAAADGYVAAASLLRGTLAIYTPSLRLLRDVALAPATREVAISRP
jgi:YVTN family beta-propeller protein